MRYLFTLFCGLMLAGCSYNYSVTEAEINQQLAKQEEQEIDLDLNGLIKLQANLAELSVKIGDRPERISVSSRSELELKSILGGFDARLESELSAIPWYAADEGAIYLKDIEFENIQIKPESLNSQLQFILPQLNFMLNQVLAEQPIYILDKADQKQALLKQFGQEIIIKHNRLEFKLAP